MHLMKCIRVLISLRVSLRSNAIPSQTQASSISQSIEDMTFSIDSANSVASFLRAALCRSVRATHSLCCVRPSSVFSLCSRQTFDNLTKPSRSLWDSWSPPKPPIVASVSHLYLPVCSRRISIERITYATNWTKPAKNHQMEHQSCATRSQPEKERKTKDIMKNKMTRPPSNENCHCCLRILYLYSRSRFCADRSPRRALLSQTSFCLKKCVVAHEIDSKQQAARSAFHPLALLASSSPLLLSPFSD